MQPEVTPGTRRALQAAAQWTAHLQRQQMGPTELLLGLLEEEEGRPVYWLRALGVAEDRVRTHFRGPGETLPRDTAATSQDLFDEALVCQLLPAARLVALHTAGEGTVSTEHLFLALLQQEETLRSQLETLGFRTAEFETKLLGEQGPPLAIDEPLLLTEPTAQMESARILDANANRAREALRVVEDYCRLVLNDAHLSKQCKQLRHDLTASLQFIPDDLLPQARDTLGDVGTRISTGSEQTRNTLRAVVVANCKRVQESLRSLEEFAKFHRPELAPKLEGLRYRTYTLEKSLLVGETALERLQNVRLYLLLTGATSTASLEWTIQEAAAGGVQMVQLREKNKSDAELMARARELRTVTRQAGVLFIINDRPDIARLVHADGVHLGQEDLSVADARRIVGPEALIGVSTHSPDQVEKAIHDGASYLGVGPTFPGATKQFEHYPGLDFVRWVATNTTLPAFAIGGINTANVGQVIAEGLGRVAVSQAIAQDDDPRQAAALLRHALEEVR